MKIQLNDKEETEFIFSWKEIWTLIKHKKLTMDVITLDNVIITLLHIRKAISDKYTNVNKTNK